MINEKKKDVNSNATKPVKGNNITQTEIKNSKNNNTTLQLYNLINQTLDFIMKIQLSFYYFTIKKLL